MSELAELLKGARIVLDDCVSPPQFSDHYLTELFNEAVTEACIRTRVIQDSTSPCTTIALVEGQATYALDASIFAVRRARVEGCRDPLRLVDTSQLDEMEPGWDDPTLSSPGMPRYAMFDSGTGTMTLTPRPASAGALRLLVWRGPAEDERLDPADLHGEPAIPVHMRRELKHWVAGQALLNTDSETRNPTLAAEQLALFEAAYGSKPTLHEIRLWSTNHRRRVTAHFD